MIADFFTKPLQGALFNKFRAVIMGWEHIDMISPSGNKERVIESKVPREVVFSTRGKIFHLVLACPEQIFCASNSSICTCTVFQRLFSPVEYSEWSSSQNP